MNKMACQKQNNWEFAFRRDFLLDYVSRRPEKLGIHKKKEFCLMLLEKCLFLVTSKVTKKFETPIDVSNLFDYTKLPYHFLRLPI